MRFNDAIGETHLLAYLALNVQIVPFGKQPPFHGFVCRVHRLPEGTL